MIAFANHIIDMMQELLRKQRDAIESGQCGKNLDEFEAEIIEGMRTKVCKVLQEHRILLTSSVSSSTVGTGTDEVNEALEAIERKQWDQVQRYRKQMKEIKDSKEQIEEFMNVLIH